MFFSFHYTKVTMPKSTTKTVKSVKNWQKTPKEKSDSSHFFDQGSLVFEWIRVNNLKNIDLTLPKNKLITITWVSWSGKSSLAFQTIYKEGQYRYIESLSSYLRQFFNLWDRPEIDYCSGLSPRNSHWNWWLYQNPFRKIRRYLLLELWEQNQTPNGWPNFTHNERTLQ